MKPAVILVADDEALNRKVLRELLTSKGFQVEEAVDGEAAGCADAPPGWV
jgi:CheY-like chemotaxis protein